MVAIYTSKPNTLEAIRSQEVVQKTRPYMGMSGIGHSCERYLWYSFHWCFTETISARKQRLFNRGHREEPAIIETLNSVGIEVYNQQEEIVAVHGHVKGHIDGRCNKVLEAPKTEHLAEFKTMNDKSFKDTRKQGVKVSKPVYYGQAQVYCYSLKITRTLFVAVNKNDDDMYIERIETDKKVGEFLINRAESTILSECPPDKKFKPTWYECRWCSANSICHGSIPVEANCRTCVGCDILLEGKWECNVHEKPLTTQEQRDGCKDYNMLEVLKK